MRRVVALMLCPLVLAACGGGTVGASVEPAPASDSGLQPRGTVVSAVPVLRVVDGDTLHVLVQGQDLTVRLIGMNTPETVKPDSPIECFGPEASEFAKQTLSDQLVTLEFDPSQGRTDKYGRTLAYVWTQAPGGGLRLFNLDSVSGGYAYERQYGPNPYAWESEFRAAQRSAQAAGAGLWDACPS